MLLYRLVITVFLFPFFIDSAAPPATDTVSENQALTRETNDVNTDVNQMISLTWYSFLNPKIPSLCKGTLSLKIVESQQVPKALQNLAD